MNARRLRSCVENWPGCYEGGYNPSCCRFPKSCSCDVYDPERVKDEDLEPEPIVDIPLPESPPGHCQLCGCPPDKMPMVFRGTGWCSENHRKELQGK